MAISAARYGKIPRRNVFRQPVAQAVDQRPCQTSSKPSNAGEQRRSLSTEYLTRCPNELIDACAVCYQGEKESFQGRQQQRLFRDMDIAQDESRAWMSVRSRTHR